MTDYDDAEPIASWEAVLLPEWRWEAYDKEDDSIYFGRVKSPNTLGKWEYGYFSQEQLEQVGAYRTDTELDEDQPLFPDGGTPEDVARLFETELDALQYLDQAAWEGDDGV